MTCPLEVVKTRLQSSCSGFQLPKIAQDTLDRSKTTCHTVPPEQRRRLWTSSCSCRPQVVALSGYVPRSATNSVTLVQCLKHIIKYEGPLALFKGKIKKNKQKRDKTLLASKGICMTNSKQVIVHVTIKRYFIMSIMILKQTRKKKHWRFLRNCR